MPHYMDEDISDDSTKDLAKIYEKTHSIEDTLLEYVEDELLNPEKPNLEHFEFVVEKLKKFAIGCYDDNPKCRRSRNDIEMAVIIWVSEEKANNIEKSDLLKRLDTLGFFIIEEARKRLRK